MNDDTANRDTSATSDSSGQDSTESAWTEPEPTVDRGEKAREWLGPLRAMIQAVAAQGGARWGAGRGAAARPGGGRRGGDAGAGDRGGARAAGGAPGGRILTVSRPSPEPV